MIKDYFYEYVRISKEIKELKEALRGIKEAMMEEMQDGEIYTDTDSEGKVWTFEKQIKVNFHVKEPKVRDREPEEKY